MAALVLMLVTTPAAGQQTTPAAPAPYDRAIAAGYKAAMLCSGIFNAGRSEAQIEVDELAGIYPQYQPLLPELPATVDRTTGVVSVTFDPQLPPRRAVFAKGRGCVGQPIGAVPPPVATSYSTPPGPAPANPARWPQGDAGIAPRPSRALAATVDRAFTGGFGEGAKTAGVVIVRDGTIVAERYADGFGPFVSNRTWSVAKSIAGTLAGIAVQDGVAKVDQPARIAAWRDEQGPNARRQITLDNLLRMASGLHSATAGNRTDAIYFGGTAVTEETTGWPVEAKPGTRFRYANNDILLAVLSLREGMGDARYATFPNTALFGPLGMTHTVAEQDWRGNFILSSQVWSTARDLARLGEFWRADGVWQGKRLLPEGWMRYMTAPTGPQPATGPGYGATMWLFGPEQGLPAGSYAAQGNRGQYVMVIPSKRLVVVRRGEDPGNARFDIAGFAKAVAEMID
ncbi:beta-lactamase family protein [Sphingomonas sp. S1-29]|uniref:serine hydrolase domain-containing protein n=1 Tax=Sphingomonas sp. S1-29 TaxID=2991074 RepID=UPI0022409F6B|nr:serine hydrolase [Sphingomonas sp. S1-29]UZK70749.1 beta-lactamase family protein [Sphingomonas sp. S1-29]